MRAPGAGGGAAVLCALVLLAGCGGDGRTAPGSTAAGSSRTDVAADATTALRERCRSAIPEEAEVEAFTLTGATGGSIGAARVGPATSDRVAVLLPQTSGLCGWGRWAGAAAEEGVTSILLDPCGYGESTCTSEEDADPLNEVTAAVGLARGEMGADRVVLLGTSMGGSLAVTAVAAGADVDGWADVSGPAAWEGVDLATLAGRLSGDGLVVMARSEGGAAFAGARDLARDAGVRFVGARQGHGWELLVDPVSGAPTALGRRLVRYAAGPSTG